jgi:hypothetical protein
LRITLSVERDTYPANALIETTLTIKNISAHAVSIMSGANSPDVRVLSSTGPEVYDPMEPLGDQSLIVPHGPGPRSFRLRAHGVWISRDDAILRGPTLAAAVMLGDVQNRNAPHSLITHPRVTVTLANEPPPQVRISASPLQATLVPPTPESGHLLVFTQTSCGDYSTGSGWDIADSPTIAPGSNGAGCHPFIWHALAGWPNHPVATILYSTGTSATRHYAERE